MPNIIHETILKDITDIIGDVKDLARDGKVALGKSSNRFTSLTKDTNDLILVFPVLCTKGISVETASMLAKAIEKNCVALLEMLFASVQISDTDNLKDYISRYHRNISNGDKITVDDFIAFTNSIKESADNGKLKITDKEVYNAFNEGMKNFNDIVKITLNENSLADFSCYKNYSGIETVLEKVVSGNTGDGIEYEYGSASFRTRGVTPREFNDKLTSNDVKKANELMPTKVVVDFYSTYANERLERGIIGVKCKLYPVDSMEIVERISSKYADTNWVRGLVRASTGEISFWRDFVFALDRARIDAINSSRKGSSARMFKVLERRATKNRLSKWKANRADSSPITTMIISQDELEYLKKEYDINLENRNIALKLMESYNFMGLVIADEPAESASFIWDEGNGAEYETLSFRNLERESNDRDFRKVISLMTKISR